MDKIKTKKKTFGTATIDYFYPKPEKTWPQVIDAVLSFEDAMLLHLGLGAALLTLNSYNRKTTEGRRSALLLSLRVQKNKIVVTEGKVRPKSNQE